MRGFAVGAIVVVAGLSALGVQLEEGAAAGGAAVSAKPAAVERGIRGCANRNRRANGLEALGWGRALSRAARLHARNMVRHDFFDHTDQLGRSVGERVAVFDRAGRFTFVGENITAGYGSAASACEGWMNSAGHRENILNPDYTHIGGGFARGGSLGRYYVQVFAALDR